MGEISASGKHQDVVCVVGLGNLYRQDDGIGLLVVAEARTHLQRPGVQFLSLGDDVTRLLDILPRCARLILVDGVVTGAPPGTVHVWSWHPELTAISARFSSHSMNPVDVLRLAAGMGESIPPTTIVGIEVASVVYGEDVSPPVRAAIPQVRRLLETWLQEAA